MKPISRKGNISNPPLKHPTTPPPTTTPPPPTTPPSTTTNHNKNTITNPPLNPSTGVSITHNNNSSSTTCASCRYFRRKCRPDCKLAPYFPPKKEKEFLNVHKLHGVSFIVKTLDVIPPRFHDDAMTSFIYSANARARDPVGGCKRIIDLLYARIDYYVDQLALVLEQIRRYRSQPPSLADQLQPPLIQFSDIEPMVDMKPDIGELIQFRHFP